MKVRVWGYQGGTLLPEGFEAELEPITLRSDGRPASYARPFGTAEGELALSQALIALLESLGIEVCVGTDHDGLKGEPDVQWLDAQTNQQRGR